ncbi:Mobile element protein [hydrothermal vent metagenome]|uniref:Mobile element protein n=1 Tax=hydrothermal vent metagenome TaxID=652676 RepID=A0A3B0SWX5_9ZZZZ
MSFDHLAVYRKNGTLKIMIIYFYISPDQSITIEFAPIALKHSNRNAAENPPRLTPPRSPQTNGMAERFNGRIKDVLQSHHFRSGEELEATLHRYVWLYNQQLPQSALGSKPPLQAMKDW